MQDPNELSKAINKVNLPDVQVASEGEELTEAEQNKVSGGGGNYGPPTADDV